MSLPYSRDSVPSGNIRRLVSQTVPVDFGENIPRSPSVVQIGNELKTKIKTYIKKFLKDSAKNKPGTENNANSQYNRLFGLNLDDTTTSPPTIGEIDNTWAEILNSNDGIKEAFFGKLGINQPWLDMFGKSVKLKKWKDEMFNNADIARLDANYQRQLQREREAELANNAARQQELEQRRQQEAEEILLLNQKKEELKRIITDKTQQFTAKVETLKKTCKMYKISDSDPLGIETIYHERELNKFKRQPHDSHIERLTSQDIDTFENGINDEISKLDAMLQGTELQMNAYVDTKKQTLKSDNQGFIRTIEETLQVIDGLKGELRTTMDEYNKIPNHDSRDQNQKRIFDDLERKMTAFDTAKSVNEDTPINGVSSLYTKKDDLNMLVSAVELSKTQLGSEINEIIIKIEEYKQEQKKQRQEEEEQQRKAAEDLQAANQQLNLLKTTLENKLEPFAGLQQKVQEITIPTQNIAFDPVKAVHDKSQEMAQEITNKEQEIQELIAAIAGIDKNDINALKDGLDKVSTIIGEIEQSIAELSEKLNKLEGESKVALREHDALMRRINALKNDDYIKIDSDGGPSLIFRFSLSVDQSLQGQLNDIKTRINVLDANTVQEDIVQDIEKELVAFKKDSDKLNSEKERLKSLIEATRSEIRGLDNKTNFTTDILDEYINNMSLQQLQEYIAGLNALQESIETANEEFEKKKAEELAEQARLAEEERKRIEADLAKRVEGQKIKIKEQQQKKQQFDDKSKKITNLQQQTGVIISQRIQDLTKTAPLTASLTASLTAPLTASLLFYTPEIFQVVEHDENIRKLRDSMRIVVKKNEDSIEKVHTNPLQKIADDTGAYDTVIAVTSLQQQVEKFDEEFDRKLKALNEALKLAEEANTEANKLEAIEEEVKKNMDQSLRKVLKESSSIKHSLSDIVLGFSGDSRMTFDEITTSLKTSLTASLKASADVTKSRTENPNIFKELSHHRNVIHTLDESFESFKKAIPKDKVTVENLEKKTAEPAKAVRSFSTSASTSSPPPEEEDISESITDSDTASEKHQDIDEETFSEIDSDEESLQISINPDFMEHANIESAIEPLNQLESMHADYLKSLREYSSEIEKLAGLFETDVSPIDKLKHTITVIQSRIDKIIELKGELESKLENQKIKIAIFKIVKTSLECLGTADITHKQMIDILIPLNIADFKTTFSPYYNRVESGKDKHCILFECDPHNETKMSIAGDVVMTNVLYFTTIQFGNKEDKDNFGNTGKEGNNVIDKVEKIFGINVLRNVPTPTLSSAKVAPITVASVSPAKTSTPRLDSI